RPGRRTRQLPAHGLRQVDVDAIVVLLPRQFATRAQHLQARARRRLERAQYDAGRRPLFALVGKPDRVDAAVLALREAEPALAVRRDGPAAVDGRTVDLHPCADRAQALQRRRRQLAVGLRADAQQQVAALGHD